MMASISTKYYQLLLSQGVCSAIGVSAVFQPALACLPGWFNRRRGAAYGIVATGSSIGGVIFPIMVSRLIDSVGFGWAMRASAFMILGLLIIANLTVHSRSHGKGYGRAPARPPQPPLALRPLLHPRFVTLMAGMFLLTFGIYIPVTFLSVQALETGNVTKELAQYLLAMLNAGSLAGRLLSGFAADRIGKYNSFLISCTCSGIVVLGLWIPGTSRDAIIAFAVLFGFFSGAYVACCRRSSPRSRRPRKSASAPASSSSPVPFPASSPARSPVPSSSMAAGSASRSLPASSSSPASPWFPSPASCSWAGNCLPCAKAGLHAQGRPFTVGEEEDPKKDESIKHRP